MYSNDPLTMDRPIILYKKILFFFRSPLQIVVARSRPLISLQKNWSPSFIAILSKKMLRSFARVNSLVSTRGVIGMYLTVEYIDERGNGKLYDYISTHRRRKKNLERRTP